MIDFNHQKSLWFLMMSPYQQRLKVCIKPFFGGVRVYPFLTLTSLQMCVFKKGTFKRIAQLSTRVGLWWVSRGNQLDTLFFVDEQMQSSQIHPSPGRLPKIGS